MNADMPLSDVQSLRSRLRQNVIRGDSPVADCSLGTVAVPAPPTWSVMAAPRFALCSTVFVLAHYSQQPAMADWGPARLSLYSHRALTYRRC